MLTYQFKHQNLFLPPEPPNSTKMKLNQFISQRLLQGFVCLLAVIISPLLASAYDFSLKTDTGVDIYYNINPDGKTVTVTYGPMEYTALSVEIPQEVTYEGNTYTVTIIGYNSFKAAKTQSIKLPETIEDIQNYAFSGSQLAEVNYPAALKYIRSYAFQSTLLTNCVLPDGILEIGTYAFHNAPIKSLRIPKTISQLATYTFSCHNLEEITIPGNVKTVGDNALGVSLTSSKTRKVTFEEGVESIGCLFYGLKSLQEVSFPSTLTTIGDRCFSETTLKNIILPNNIKSIGSSCFAKCAKLESITFSNGMSELPTEICESCINLTKVTIPGGIEKIGVRAFSGCKLLSRVNLPESVEFIGGYCFEYSGIVDFKFPPKVTTINDHTFSYCHNLTKLTIPEGILKINDYAFTSCENLTELIFPHSLTEIGSNVLQGCSSLKEITLYHQLNTVHNRSFVGALNKIHLHRAVVPNYVSDSWTIQTVIPEGNSCTLYVPKGSGDSYKANYYWNKFMAIEEVDMPDNLNYQITFPSSTFGGNLSVNGEKPKTLMEFAMNSEITITATPNNGYHLKSLLINGEDVTSEMSDGSYTIKNLNANYTVSAEFAENPVRLSLFMAVGGSVDVEIEKRDTFSCFITPEEGWQINNVRFNGSDVTASLTDDNRYTTPAITRNSELRVTFENVNSAVENIGLDASAVKVYVDADGLVTIEGLEAGQTVSAYSVGGQLVDRITSSGSGDTLRLYNHGIYLIQTPAKTYKIHY